MAEIIAFPIVRRRAFVCKQAARVADAPTSRTAERLIADILNRQAAAMRRRGLSEEAVQVQVHSLECAIRTELWHLVLQPGGAA
ncbi:DUF6074 family protein [Propylenella binzhouense]|uniref:Uncharacterized protein n=1 Tax=Propylenella binzhouense TaxID=2555902 RepID=A0A964WSX0_9HYPH|nr:DUF6074 family protein [Propylenella binzhouense]MYZ47331.1 hypothetical protein [Propylenella binzhouense]